MGWDEGFNLCHFTIKIFEMNIAKYDHLVNLGDGFTVVCFINVLSFSVFEIVPYLEIC